MKKLNIPIKARVIIGVALLAVIGILVRTFVLGDPFYYAGTLEATRVDLSAEVASVVQSVGVREGEHIKAGQELMTLACEDIRLAASLAEKNDHRNAKLYRSGSVSQEARDLTHNHLLEAKVREGRCNISSPIDGVVLSRYREPGEFVGPGSRLLTLGNLQQIWAMIYIPQPQVAGIKLGSSVSALLPELGRTFQGQVVHISDEAEFTPKNVQTRSERTRLIYGVKVSFAGANADEVLKPGMTVEIQLPTAAHVQ